MGHTSHRERREVRRTGGNHRAGFEGRGGGGLVKVLGLGRNDSPGTSAGGNKRRMLLFMDEE